MLHSFEVNEQTPAYWYEDQYYEPTTVQFIPQAAKVVDAHNDQEFDIIMPLNKGYRTGVDTRENFLFFENKNGDISYNPELTSKMPYISGARRADIIELGPTQQKSLVTVAHDTAIIEKLG